MGASWLPRKKTCYNHRLILDLILHVVLYFATNNNRYQCFGADRFFVPQGRKYPTARSEQR